jgi:hypothetical protein
MNSKSHSGFIVLVIALIALLAGSLGPAANTPPSPYYSDNTSQILWFIQTSDTHIGTSGSTDTNNLTWLVTTAKSTIAPSFIIVTGDLTDSTNGNWLGLPNGPYQAEWDAYKGIVDGRITADDYYDLPGNHDEYNDGDFSYYLANSVQGRTTHRTQASFTRIVGSASYHFLGINTADNTGDPFSLTSPYGDHAGLDANELAYIATELDANKNAALTMVFGHHPLAPTGNSQDTYVYYGLESFLDLMNVNYGVLYGYGHTHAFSEALLNPGSGRRSFFYLNTASLGKSSSNQYTVFAIDCNGISSVPATKGTWPVVLITAPVDRYYGNATSPYGYDVPASTSSPIRALAFDPSGISKMEYRIDSSATWNLMTPVANNLRLWSAAWNSSNATQGDHVIEVRATNASNIAKSNAITARVLQTQPPPTLISHIDSLKTGKYAAKTGLYSETTGFSRGDTVVFRAQVSSNSVPLAGAVVTLSITGPENLTVTSVASGSNGIAEAKWVTKAASKRTAGTKTGSYTATVKSVTASGYTWDNQTLATPATFAIN